MFEKMQKRNTYTFVRHGFSVSNRDEELNCKKEKNDGLTERGKQQVEEIAKTFTEHTPDIIFCSPLTRTRETAEYIAEKTGAKVIEDSLLTELQVPDMHGKSIHTLKQHIRTSGAYKDITKKIMNGESFADVYTRVLQFFEKIDKEYKEAHIVVVTHRTIITTAKSIAPTMKEFQRKYKINVLKPTPNASKHKVLYKHIKRAKDGEVDVHRPYIDEIVLYDEEGNPAYHTKEVFDCWFESGAMPYGLTPLPI